jgi:uncharacterized protein (TIGR03083 family)
VETTPTLTDGPTFTDLLRLLDERTTAFTAAVAPSLSGAGADAPVPTCPGWTVRDLVRHLITGRRKWAAIVAAGPAPEPVAGPPRAAAPTELEALLEALAAAARDLRDALRGAGPDRGCWTWWDTSQSPSTSGAVARHQVQEVAVHTYDAQLALGVPQPLPPAVALDGVEEFLFTCVATTTPWPHAPAVVDYHATEGRSWRLWLSGEGARVARLSPGPPGDPGFEGRPADASATGPAGDLVLWFYGRVPMEPLALGGDRRPLQQLIDWDPDAPVGPAPEPAPGAPPAA